MPPCIIDSNEITLIKDSEGIAYSIVNNSDFYYIGFILFIIFLIVFFILKS